MSKTKDKTKNVLLPGPMRMVWGALAAYYLKDIIHPAFTLIAVMILLMIPVLIANMFFPERKSIVLDKPIEEDVEESA
ncbi:MAG: hypothetical protein K9L22_00455 [Methylococcaceae bacterium]|nr:hypothetical protein [Methylococcaceae bacterium]